MADPQIYPLDLSNVTIKIQQGSTYFNKWELLYQDGPFPFFNDSDELLWDIGCSIRDSYLISPGDVEPYLVVSTIDIANEANSGCFITKETTTDGVMHTYFGLYITATDTATLPVDRLIYNIKITRISDSWKIRIQEGICVILPDII